MPTQYRQVAISQGTYLIMNLIYSVRIIFIHVTSFSLVSDRIGSDDDPKSQAWQPYGPIWCLWQCADLISFVQVGDSLQSSTLWTDCFYTFLYGGFRKWGYPNIDGLLWNIPLKWMIGGYPYCRTPPYVSIQFDEITPVGR